jgi:two-component system, cell cycle response regulator DivK
VSDDLILVVDDNDKNLRLARDLLRVNGFRTLEASTAGEALTLAAEQLPDVILMDVRLPDMSGVEAVRQLKAEPSTATIPVIALTAFAMDGQREWLLDAGFDDYVAKPIDIHTFPEAVREHCRD